MFPKILKGWKKCFTVSHIKMDSSHPVIWKLKPPSSSVSRLAREAGITPLQAQLLINRGILIPAQVSSFLNPRLSNMADPMLMRGMPDALEIILRSIENREKITIYGDYDADGLTATALLAHFFSSLGIQVSFYIPNRLTEGYSLNEEAISKIAEDGTKLIITVDCGTNNIGEIALAKGLGMDVVVTDHHQVSEDFQAQCPVVNPQQPGCPFPFKDLAGVGLAFFLTVAVRTALRRTGWFRTRSEPDLREYLDLVALGTVADRVPLLDQNRILVHYGIGAMAESRWAGITAMKEVAGIENPGITSDDLAFRLGPRLNAPGRMGDSRVGLKTLISHDPDLSRDLALSLNAANNQRQRVELSILHEIEERIRKNERIRDSRTLVVAGEDWHKGVLGIVASRLVDKYHCPSLVFSLQGDMAYGSGRSIEGFNLYKALSKLSYLFENFGGHAHAAGFSMKTTNLKALENKLESLAHKALRDSDMVPAITIDAKISLDDIGPEMLHEIDALSPFGEGNPEPSFYAGPCEVLESRIVGERHLKLRVRQEKKIYEAIGFGMSDRHPLEGTAIRMVFTPELNHWQGYEKIQLRVADFAQNGEDSGQL
jgi:single-stranded-DNA-specific exonuclease